MCADTMNIVCKILRNFDHINVVVIEHVIIVQVWKFRIVWVANNTFQNVQPLHFLRRPYKLQRCSLKVQRPQFDFSEIILYY